MNYTIVKYVATAVTSVGVNQLMKGAINIVLATEVRATQRVLMGIGGFVVSTMVAGKAVDYVTEKVDEIHEMFTGMETQTKEKTV